MTNEQLGRLVKAMKRSLDDCIKLLQQQGRAEPERLYSVKETSELTSISPTQIRRYMKAGRIACQKIGGRVVIPAGEIIKLQG